MLWSTLLFLSHALTPPTHTIIHRCAGLLLALHFPAAIVARTLHLPITPHLHFTCSEPLQLHRLRCPCLTSVALHAMYTFTCVLPLSPCSHLFRHSFH